MENKPIIDETAVILPGAIVTGNAAIGPCSSVWHNTVIRADIGSVEIGAGSNIQDGCILHMGHDTNVQIGKGVTVGHGCILHGCTLRDGAFVGMGSIILDGAVLEEGCMVGAGSLVTSGTVILAGMLAFGRPATIVRPLAEEEKAQNREVAESYVRLAKETQGPHR